MSNAPESSESTRQQSPLLAAIVRLRFISGFAVISSLVGALLMFWIGTVNTVKAVAIAFELSGEAKAIAAETDLTELAAVQLLEALDNFLVGLAFLYFAYGIYSLFVTFKSPPADVPDWLQVSSIATLKKSLLEVVVVLLSVAFVKGLFEQLVDGTLNWELLVVPLSIVAIALATRLMNFDEETK